MLRVLSLFLFFATLSFATEKPNVLFVICDDLNTDIGSYGHPQVKTPHIDRLAERGVRFENAHCQFSLCGPSRASFMTGLYPDQSSIVRNAVYIRERLPKTLTMSQLFRENDYRATRIGKIYHYNVPLHQGTSGHDDPYSWDLTINPRGRDIIELDQVETLVPGKYGATLSWLAAKGTDEEQTDGIVATEAIEQLEKYAAEDQAFFLAVGLYRPHTPYVAPQKYFDMYPLDAIKVPKVPANYYETIPKAAKNSIRTKKDQIDLADEVARKVIQAYYASITFADAQFGRILDTLEETGLAENTVVVFTSDHGYHMGEHGHWQKRSLYENGTRVPLVIASPNQKEKGAVSDAPAEMIDFYKTLAELCGLETPGYVQGHSLVPVLDDATVSVRKNALTQLDVNGYTIKTEQHRYIEWGEDGAGGKELYDHETDPDEMRNLAGDPDYESIETNLRKELRDRIADAQIVPKGVIRFEYDEKERVSY